MVDNQKRFRIMVVDDEKIITMHLEELLTNMGYNVVATASNGEEAIEKAEKSEPDLIFMDIIMPGEMSGIDAAIKIKEQFNIPIVFLTAFADDKIVEKAKISEPFSYIIKPFNSQELKAAIEIAIYKKNIEKMLAESELKYRTLVDGSRDGIGLIQDGQFKFANPALLDMLGKPEDLINTNVVDFFAKDCKTSAENIFVKWYGQKVPSYTKLLFQKSNGSLVPVETSVSMVQYDEEPAVLAIFRNVSEKKHVKCMFDNLVHEINEQNQLMIPKLEQLMSLSKNQNKKENIEAVISTLFKSANLLKRAYKLLQMEFSHRELTPIDLVEKINDAVQSLNNNYPDLDIFINTHLSGVVPPVLADDCIEDIFQLLFENSLDISSDPKVEFDVFIKANSTPDPSTVDIEILDKFSEVCNKSSDLNSLHLFPNHKSIINTLELSITESVISKYRGDFSIDKQIYDGNFIGWKYSMRLPSYDFSD